jgi:hypothetical protein
MQKIVLMLATLIALQSCALWPYKSDFDCKTPEGEKCKSLYEVNSLTDSGKYAPEIYFKADSDSARCRDKNCKHKNQSKSQSTNQFKNSSSKKRLN